MAHTVHAAHTRTGQISGGGRDRIFPWPGAAVLWGYRHGPILHLVRDPGGIPPLVPARDRCSFDTRGALVFAARSVPVVQTLGGNRIVGPAFNCQDAAGEFLRLKARGIADDEQTTP